MSEEINYREAYEQAAKAVNKNYDAWFNYVKNTIESTINKNYKEEGATGLSEIAARTLLNNLLEMYLND